MNISNKIILVYPSLLKVQVVQTEIPTLVRTASLPQGIIQHTTLNTLSTEQNWTVQLPHIWFRNFKEHWQDHGLQILEYRLPHVIFQYAPRGHCSLGRLCKRWQVTKQAASSWIKNENTRLTLVRQRHTTEKQLMNNVSHLELDKKYHILYLPRKKLYLSYQEKKPISRSDGGGTFQYKFEIICHRFT